jgi:hypothetical protein
MIKLNDSAMEVFVMPALIEKSGEIALGRTVRGAAGGLLYCSRNSVVIG